MTTSMKKFAARAGIIGALAAVPSVWRLLPHLPTATTGTLWPRASGGNWGINTGTATTAACSSRNPPGRGLRRLRQPALRLA